MLNLYFTHQFLDRQTVMCRNVLQYSVQQSHFQRPMIGNADVMFTTTLGGHMNMGSGLPLCLVAQMSKGTDQFGAVAVPWNFHRAKTSSRM